MTLNPKVVIILLPLILKKNKPYSCSYISTGLAIASRTSGGDSEWYWETGKEYVYQYSGRLLTGIPELADVYSGVGINCTVHIQRSTKSSEENMFYLSIKDPKYVRVNEKLESASPSTPNNWRELRLPELTEVLKQFFI